VIGVKPDILTFANVRMSGLTPIMTPIMSNEADKMAKQMMIGSRRRGKYKKMNLQRT